MQNLKVTIIQTDLFWEDIEKNLEMFDALIEGISEKTEIILLPEMFTTGFSMDAARLAQPMAGPAVSWMLEKAALKKAVIAGSIICSENGAFYNRFIWATPDKRLLYYDKRHLFRMSEEEKVYSPGRCNLTAEIGEWRIRPFICYDLRFPEWTRNLNNTYDLAVFVASWPASRQAHWQALLKARAIENQSYVIGINRTGVDGNMIAYSGCSTTVDFTGKILFEIIDEPCVATLTLRREPLLSYRREFPAWMDAGILCDEFSSP